MRAERQVAPGTLRAAPAWDSTTGTSTLTGGGNYYRAPMIEGRRTSTSPTATSPTSSPTTPSSSSTRQLDSDAPFSLNVHYTAPHAPWGREHHHRRCRLQRGIHDDCAPSTPSRTRTIHRKPARQGTQEPPPSATRPENRRLALSGYFAAIEEMDRNIGQPARLARRERSSGRTPSLCSTPTTA